MYTTYISLKTDQKEEIQLLKVSEGVEVPIINLKMVKVLFNRAFRLKSRDSGRAMDLFQAILGLVTTLVGQKTYYHAKVLLEMSRCLSGDDETKSEQYLNAAKEILIEKYGEDHSVYIDFLVGLTEFQSRNDSETETLMATVDQLLRLTEASNLKRKGNSMLMLSNSQSAFLMEPMLMLAQSTASTISIGKNESKEIPQIAQMNQILEDMQVIQIETFKTMENAYLWRVKASIGVVHMQAGQFEKAIEILQEVLESQRKTLDR